jgi:hypothetical protein
LFFKWSPYFLNCYFYTLQVFLFHHSTFYLLGFGLLGFSHCL